MKFRWLIVLIVLVGAIGSRPTAAQDDELPPYIMYYVGDGFRIERADGSDSRPFAAGLMPSDTVAVKGPGWSPSGDYFAWTSDTGIALATLDIPYVVGADGTLAVTFPPDTVDATLHWAPDRDVLIAVLWRMEGGRGAALRFIQNDIGPVPTTAMLDIQFIDPTTDTVLNSDVAEVGMNGFQGLYHTADQVRWQGDHALITLYSDGPEDFARIQAIFDNTGDGLGAEMLIASDHPSINILEHSLARGDWFSAVGIDAFWDPSGIWLRNSFTGDEARLILDGRGEAVSWSPQGDQALVETDGGLWLVQTDLAIASPTTTFLETEHGPANFGPYAGYQISAAGSYWSPDGRWVALVSDGEWVVYDTVAAEWILTGFALEAATLEDEHVGHWLRQWTDDTLIVARSADPHGYGGEFVFFHLPTRTQTVYNFGNTIGRGRLGVTADVIIHFYEDVTIYDRATARAQTVYAYPESDGISTGSVILHPTAPYFIIREADPFYGEEPVQYSLGAVDGTHIRALSSCQPSGLLCAFWLPPQVNVG